MSLGILIAINVFAVSALVIFGIISVFVFKNIDGAVAMICSVILAWLLFFSTRYVAKYRDIIDSPEGKAYTMRMLTEQYEVERAKLEVEVEQK